MDFNQRIPECTQERVLPFCAVRVPPVVGEDHTPRSVEERVHFTLELFDAVLVCVAPCGKEPQVLSTAQRDSP